MWSNYENITNSTLNIVRVPSGQIIKRAVNYTYYNYTTQPNVLISYDAIQAYQYSDDNIFVNFTLANNQSLQPQLKQLYNTSAGKPYQYNIISLIYDEHKINLTNIYNVTFYNQSTYSNFTLESIFNATHINGSIYDARNWTIVNPTTDSTGLGFLLWTVSEYGDIEYNITGPASVYGDWRYYWQRLFSQNVSIVNSWTEAFDLYSDPSSNVGIISSYGLDPAYNVCQNFTNNIIPLVSTHKNTRYAWSEIIEMGVLNKSSQQQQQEGINFIDYVFDNIQVQNQTIYQDWSMPANSNVSLPQCYYDSHSVLPTQVSLYNIPLLKQIQLNSTIINSWLYDWSLLQNNTYNSSRLHSKYSLKNIFELH